MKDIELCGIGNALVDIQIEVLDDVLKELGLKKGTMTLVDTSSQSSILDFVLSRVFDKKINKNQMNTFSEGKNNINYCSGGSAANSIIAFSRFGGKAAYITSIGDDDFGEYYLKDFNELGIVLDAQKIINTPTGTCLVMISPDSERTMATCTGASSLLRLEEINFDLVKRSQWLYIEGYKLTEPDGFEFCKKLLDFSKLNNTKTAFTFSDIFITENFKYELDYITRNCNLIFCNKSEALSWTQTNHLELAIEKFNEIINNFVITSGENGSIVKWNRSLNGYDNNIAYIPAYPIKAVDTTGAGDMFAGSFLFGLMRTNNPVISAKMASYTSALVVSQPGARLNADYDNIAKKFLSI